MVKEIVMLASMTFMGIFEETSDPVNRSSKNQIDLMWMKYFRQGYNRKIPNQKDSDLVYSMFLRDCKNANRGTYIIGNEIIGKNCSRISGLMQHTVPAQTYVKFTTEKGKMPDVYYKAWDEISKMSEEELGGKRTYIDFEKGRISTHDPDNSAVEIYVGIHKK